jgi:hypothetical protein
MKAITSKFVVQRVNAAPPLPQSPPAIICSFPLIISSHPGVRLLKRLFGIHLPVTMTTSPRQVTRIAPYVKAPAAESWRHKGCGSSFLAVVAATQTASSMALDGTWQTQSPMLYPLLPVVRMTNNRCGSNRRLYASFAGHYALRIT